MELKRYTNADDFLNDNHQFLFANEAANNLIIGIANILSASKVRRDVLICSVKERDNTLLASIMMPPRDFIVARRK
jgi:hypothetical protein